jgi:hypothetical protein
MIYKGKGLAKGGPRLALIFACTALVTVLSHDFCRMLDNVARVR